LEAVAMSSLRRLAAGSVVLGLATIGFGGSPAQAIQVLVNGGLEQGGGGPASWTLTNSVTGQPSTFVGGTELIDQGNNPGPPMAPGIGLVVNSSAGDEGALSGLDLQTNTVLVQTAPVTAGKDYILKGDAELQSSSSNFMSPLGVVIPGFDYNQDFAVDAADYTVWRDTLGQTGTGLAADGDGNGTIDQADYDLWKTNFGHVGHGAIPSPTTTTFKLEFLNGPGANATVLGTQTLDIRADTVAPDVWQTHTLPQITAPAGATNARVTVSALNMIHACNQNCTGDRFVYLDNFSLTQQGLFGTDHLTNGNLNTPGAPAGFTVTNSVADNFQFSTADFANIDLTTLPPPGHGVAGETGLWLRAFQGGDFTIAQTVPGVVGDQYTFSAWSKWEANFRGADSLSSTQDFLKIEFLNASSGVISSQMLDLRTVQMNDGTWRQLSMSAATAPAGTVNVRVSEITTGMVQETCDHCSAMLDNFSLIQTGSGSGAAVPEPSSFALFGIGLGIIGIWRRR
jgi:hypothetical protein